MAPANRRKLLKSLGAVATASGISGVGSAKKGDMVHDQQYSTKEDVREAIREQSEELLEYVYEESSFNESSSDSFSIPTISGREEYHESDEATTVATVEEEGKQIKIILIRRVVAGSKFVFNIKPQLGEAHAIEYPDYNSKKDENTDTPTSDSDPDSIVYTSESQPGPIASADKNNFVTVAACIQSDVCRKEPGNCHKWSVKCCIQRDFCIWSESVGACYGGTCYSSCCQPCNVSTC